jgi:hypothetical protein
MIPETWRSTRNMFSKLFPVKLNLSKPLKPWKLKTRTRKIAQEKLIKYGGVEFSKGIESPTPII